MKKYEYVKLNMKVGFFSTKSSSYQKVIDEYASKGYRYVGWIPSSTSNMLSGVPEEIDLIFEIDV